MNIRHMTRNPGAYRKLFVYLGMLVLVILNEFLGVGIDEDLYTDKLKEAVNILILIGGGWGVWRAPNDR